MEQEREALLLHHINSLWRGGAAQTPPDSGTAEAVDVEDWL